MGGAGGQLTPDPLSGRRAGVLLHPTSLPGPGPRGDLGHAAYRFVEFAAAAGFSVWQTLPLGPTHEDGSPYQCLSVHAGNVDMISLDWLVDRGWLKPETISANGKCSLARRRTCLKRAYACYQSHADAHWREAFNTFTAQCAGWLEDYALYSALRAEQGGRAWFDWPDALRAREHGALDEAAARLAKEIDQVRFEQFVFFRQWAELRDYAHRHGLYLFGDMPIFVAHDSAEVWAHREYFDVDAHGQAATVAGVPPDYFSETGQRWGNPHYHWERMEADGFAWWVERMRTQLALFDIVRIDHFRGFEAYWSIPAEAETAVDGHWVKAPGAVLLRTLQERFERLPLVAEDLGVITAEVDALRREFGLPGMKILQFAFGSDAANPYLPHHHTSDSVVYTGTHDNDTTLGWYAGLDEAQQAHVLDYLGQPGEPMPWPLVRTALASVAGLAVLPMQDLLGLDGSHRMNRPGTTRGNWRWRFEWEQLPADLVERLRHLNTLYDRSPPPMP